MKADVLIVGGGLSGLRAATLLGEAGASYLLLEARSEPGGRIRILHRDEQPYELGASWFWPETNTRLAELVETLGLPHFAQHTTGDAIVEDDAMRRKRLPHQQLDDRRARRLVGGTGVLVEALHRRIPASSVRLGAHVRRIEEEGGRLAVVADGLTGLSRISARHVIIAMPPRIAAATLEFRPELPPQAIAAMERIPTWMAGESKFFAIYDVPFWREAGLSGSLFSSLGPLAEAHDLSFPEGPGVLTGFLHEAWPGMHPAETTIDACLAQLTRCFGEAAARPVDSFLHGWAGEELVATVADVPLKTHPHYHFPADCVSLFGGKLHLAGTEVASEHGGYLEGALCAAERAVAAAREG